MFLEIKLKYIGTYKKNRYLYYKINVNTYKTDDIHTLTYRVPATIR